MEAREKLRYYDMSPEERHEYDEHINAIMIQDGVLNTTQLEGLTEGRAECKTEGRTERIEIGIEKNRYEIAKQMKADGLPVKAIQKIYWIYRKRNRKNISLILI